jgi:hypothetical protein
MPTLHTWRYPGAREISATEARAQRESLMARPAEGEILASSCRGAHLPNHQGTGTFRRLPSSLNRKGSGAPRPATRLREDMWAVALGRTAVNKTPIEAQGSGTKAPLPPRDLEVPIYAVSVPKHDRLPHCCGFCYCRGRARANPSRIESDYAPSCDSATTPQQQLVLLTRGSQPFVLNLLRIRSRGPASASLTGVRRG